MQADGSAGVAGEAGCLLNGTCFFFFAGTGVETRQAERHFGMRLFSLGRRSPLLAVPGKGQ